MMMKNPRNCSRAFFSHTACCEDVSNNFAESYNSAIDKARSMPIVEMLETIRRQTMVRIDARIRKAVKHTGKYSLKVANTIAEEESHRKYCISYPGANGWYEVVEKGCSFRVHMIKKTCACRRWDMTGIPCRHALCVILLKKLNTEDYVSDWYLTSTWVAQYSDSIRPLNGMEFWEKSDKARIQAPSREVSLGPKKKQKRKKSKHESPTKKLKVKGLQGAYESHEKQLKATKVGRTFHCGRCSSTEHNIRRCTSLGVVYKRSKRTTQGVCESITLGHGEGPSQNQPSQNLHQN